MNCLNSAAIRLSGWITAIRHANSRLSFAILSYPDGNQFSYRTIQLVIDREKFSIINKLTPESCITVSGLLKEKYSSVGKENQKEMELKVDELFLHNPAAAPLPIRISENPSEELRLRYRYLDLRQNKSMQENLAFRSKFLHSLRTFLHSQNFTEMETPLLFKSTPEGAEEFLVPLKDGSGTFALPQSPQQFKQMLIIGGVPAYFQIAKCFRNEDLRNDRQPEFTQLDLEMAFADEFKIRKIIEEALCYALPNQSLSFKSITYSQAMQSFGSDKPIIDNWEIKQISQNDKVVEEKLEIPKDYCELAKHSLEKDQTIGTLEKHFCPSGFVRTIRRLNCHPGTTCLGKIRACILQKQEAEKSPRKKENYNFLWVNEFPLFYQNENSKEIESMHHPFTAPNPEDLDMLENFPNLVRGLHYDLVLNGVEVGGGSVRIHSYELQKRVFSLLGIQSEPFSHLLEALQFGAPPHAGIALGLDRLVAMLCGSSSIREVIAFPKSTSGKDLLFKSPTKFK